MSIEDCCGSLEIRLITVVGQLAPSDELGFVFQVSTAFTAIAFYRRRQNPERDTFAITAAWTLLGTLARGSGRGDRGAAQLIDDGRRRERAASRTEASESGDRRDNHRPV